MNKSTNVGKWSENGKAIRRARLRTGLSQEKLAALIGTTRRHMIRLENGEHLPLGTLRDRLCDVLGIDHDAIQSGDDEQEVALPGDTFPGNGTRGSTPRARRGTKTAAAPREDRELAA
jgi:transcriptional regulator with XRE-family HTH domain